MRDDLSYPLKKKNVRKSFKEFMTGCLSAT